MAAAIILAAMAGITLARPEDHRIAAGPTTDRTADTGRIDDAVSLELPCRTAARTGTAPQVTRLWTPKPVGAPLAGGLALSKATLSLSSFAAG